MPDPDDDALPRARPRPGDASQADQHGEARRSHRAHGGWAVGGVSVFPGASASLCRHDLHARATAQCSQGRAERSVHLRLREEIQEMLRWGDCELNPAAQYLRRGISQPRSEGSFLWLRYIDINTTSQPVPSPASAASRLDLLDCG